MEDSMEIPLNTRNKTTIWPSNPTPRHIPWETKIEKDTCIPLFTASLFTVARTWKQPRCPSTDEWIKTLWYTMEYYSAIKRNTFEYFLMRWVNLEPIIQSEVSPKEKELTRRYMESRKTVLMIFSAGQQWRHGSRGQTYGHGGAGKKERVRRTERVTWKLTLSYMK